MNLVCCSKNYTLILSFFTFFLESVGLVIVVNINVDISTDISIFKSPEPNEMVQKKWLYVFCCR